MGFACDFLETVYLFRRKLSLHQMKAKMIINWQIKSILLLEISEILFQESHIKLFYETFKKFLQEYFKRCLKLLIDIERENDKYQ